MFGTGSFEVHAYWGPTVTVDNATIRQLVAMAHTAPSADNSQPWKLNWDGETLEIAYDSARVAGKTFLADSPATLLSMGAVIEILMMVASDWGLEPSLTVLDVLPEPSTNIYATIQFHSAGLAAPEGFGAHSASSRHTNRLPYLSQSVPGKLTQELELLCENGARIVILKDSEKIKQLGKIVTMASQIRFQTQEVHEWLDRSLRFSTASAARGDGMDVATLGLPPGGKLFLRLISKWRRMRLLNKVGIYKLVSAIDAAPVKQASTLMAVIAASDATATLNAGRLMARAWIHLNMRGLSAHPYYVVADQLARLRAGAIPENLAPQAYTIEQASRETLEFGDGETLHMLFRIGYANKAPKLSQRLSLDAIYNEKSHP